MNSIEGATLFTKQQPKNSQKKEDILKRNLPSKHRQKISNFKTMV